VGDEEEHKTEMGMARLRREREIIFLLRRNTHLQKWVRVCRDEIIIFFLLLLLLQQL
jgi:hypothetical protein